MKKNKVSFNIKKIGLFVVVLAALFTFASCSLIADIASTLIHGATDTLYNFIASYFDRSDPDNAIYGSDNELAVGFDDGVMVAFWDDYGDYSYSVRVNKAGQTSSYDVDGESCKLNLEEAGYDYSDDLSLSLYGTNENNQTILLANYSYNGISKKHYLTYTENMPGGWQDLDRYIATRYELFEMFNYIIIFQPDMVVKKENGNTYYCSETTLFLGYDYLSIYPQGTTIEDAYSTEIKSAISAFDDSAGYNYSHNLESNFVECTIYLRFSYQAFPTLVTDTNKKYTQKSNVGLDWETPHYNLSNISRNREFAIDKVQRTVAVETSDQLYFALKRQYKPLCKAGSNAEYIYNYMRDILSRINADITPDWAKIHYIYDYIVDTVLYDYEFVENVITEEKYETDFFLYKCLYMEGVFGFTNEKTFDNNYRVAICDGIAKAVLSMCAIEGIPVVKVSGKSNGVAHAWNKVQIQGSWYLVDATWGNMRKAGSKVETFSHDYLLVADDYNHIEDKWIKYPPAPNSAPYPFDK
ncbi:MAG: hypothetical protein GX242_02085 [Clostridiales bacterium]|nr:hypothetical protein [Clostridiales bacterium]